MDIRNINDNTIEVTGYVNAVERDSKELNSNNTNFVEQITAGAFKRALAKGKNVKILFNHDSTRELGNIEDNTLELFEDSIGLRVKATITDTEVINYARKGLLTGWSFGFKALKDRWEDTTTKIKRRFVEDLDLFEVSILTKTPAYSGTLVEVRSNEIDSNLAVECVEEVSNIDTVEEDLKPNSEDVREEIKELEVDKLNFSVIKNRIFLLKQ